MSFNKVVNGVTFTSDKFTNIDVSFESKGFFTYIYISTTDNQTFNNNTTSDYHIDHDGITLGVTQILLENDNKTAKLYVHTREFTKYNSYNIQQLPLKQSTEPEQPPEKPYTLADVGLQCLDENATLSVTENSATLSAVNGYKITSASITSKKHNIFQNKYNFTISDDGSSATITLVPSKEFDYYLQVTTEVQSTEPEKPYTLADVGLQCLDENATLKVTENTATLTAVSGHKITSAKIDVKKHNIFKESHPFAISEDGLSATITLVPSKEFDYYLQVTTEVQSTEPEKPYTLADVGLQCLDENATLKVTENTATLTAVSGHKITSAKIDVKKHNIFKESHPFAISDDGSSATITLTPSKELDYDLKITTEPIKNFNGEIVLNNEVKDKIKFYFDKQRTVKITVIDNKYTINSLYYLYQPRLGASWVKSSKGFTINEDKKTATLFIPDEVIVSDDTSYIYKLKIGGDIADTTPIKPETTTAKTQRVYMIDDKGINELTKQAEKYFDGSKNTNYDFTQFINQLYYLPFTVDENLSDPTSKISTGLWELNAPAREMKDRVLNIDLGTINVIPENNNGFDYNIESIRLYLPLVLPFEIDFQDCYKKIISINYKINLLTGNATINISSNDKIISTFNQNVQTNLQMFNIYNNKDFGSLNNPIINEILTPYIKVNYYKPVENLVSYETLEHNNLSSYTNFVKIRNASVSCGTQEEQTEIENLLNGGIYINDITRYRPKLK